MRHWKICSLASVCAAALALTAPSASASSVSFSFRSGYSPGCPTFGYSTWHRGPRHRFHRPFHHRPRARSGVSIHFRTGPVYRHSWSRPSYVYPCCRMTVCRCRPVFRDPCRFGYSSFSYSSGSYFIGSGRSTPGGVATFTSNSRDLNRSPSYARTGVQTFESRASASGSTARRASDVPPPPPPRVIPAEPAGRDYAERVLDPADLRRGWRLVAVGHYGAAGEYFENRLGADPGSSEAALGVSLAGLLADDMTRAREGAAALARLDPGVIAEVDLPSSAKRLIPLRLRSIGDSEGDRLVSAVALASIGRPWEAVEHAKAAGGEAEYAALAEAIRSMQSGAVVGGSR